MAKGAKNKTKVTKGNKANVMMQMKSPTGNLLNMLNVRTAGNVNGMKNSPYLYRTTLR